MQIKYNLFLDWLESNVEAKESQSIEEIQDSFFDTIEDETPKEDDNIFLEIEEVPEIDESSNKEIIKEETNVLLNFNLTRRPSVLEILGISEDDPIDQILSPVSKTKSKVFSHKKGKAPEPPSSLSICSKIAPESKIKEKNEQNIRTLSNAQNNENHDDFGKETQI